MRKVLSALPVAILAHSALGACIDSTAVIGGNGTVVYNPASLNSYIAACADTSSMTITLDFPNGDTLKLTSEIIVGNRPPQARNSLIGRGRSGGPLILAENNPGDPQLMVLNSPTAISNFSFVRKVSSATFALAVAAKGSSVTDCDFFMTDNSGTGTGGGLVSITADSVLMQRSLFRTPPNGKGRAIAIVTGGSSLKTEIRSNIFNGTGLHLAVGSFHVFANTFVGSRDDYNAIIVGTGVSPASSRVNIQHNLFAAKVDTLPPIAFAAGGVTSVDSILKNAYSSSRATPVLAVGPSGAAVTLNNATGQNGNQVLPRGFSRYGPSAGAFKEYPLVQLRTDSLLAKSHADFGKIPSLFNTSVTNWTTIPDVSAGLPANRLYFPAAFLPLNAGQTWTGLGAGIKVGALVVQDASQVPSPLDSGTLANSALAFSRLSTDSTRIKLSRMSINAAYYRRAFLPSELYFFFSSTLDKLAANDSASLKTAVGAGAFSKRAVLGFDSILTVPKEVRTGGDVYVKLLHYNQYGQAAVLSQGAIARVTGVPDFPVNDLSITVVAVDAARGEFTATVRKNGSEIIDSVIVSAIRVGGAIEETQTKAAPALNATVSFDFQLDKGTFVFNATPKARLGATFKTGQPTANSPPVQSQQLTGDTVWVAHQNVVGACAGTGQAATPWSCLDSAYNFIAARQGGTIMLKNAATPVPFDNVVIPGIAPSDTFTMTISIPNLGNAYDPAHRVVFQGSATAPALKITRRNVILNGVILDMPAGSSTAPAALSVEAGGVVVNGCVIRPRTAAAAPGVAVNIASGQDMRLVNTLIWGYTTAVQVGNNPSTGVHILHNTFLADSTLANFSSTVGITAPGAAFNGVIANNYFSGIATPYAESLTGKGHKLDRNAYTTSAPDLQGIAENGLDSVPIFAASQWMTHTLAELAVDMNNHMGCSELKPCHALYAGASATAYGAAVTTDLMGKPRLGRAEVGAFEADPDGLSIRGVLSVDATPLSATQGGDSRLLFTIKPKTFDSADADSLHVWWSSSPNPRLVGSIPAAFQRKYRIDRLVANGLTDTATGLSSNILYYVYAALGKNTGTRIMGYGYMDTASTKVRIVEGDCPFNASKTCPGTGVFSSPDPYPGDFTTTVTFAEPDSGLVKMPTFEMKGGVTGNVQVQSTMPNITLSIDAAKLKAAGSRQSWTAAIQFRDDPGDGYLAGKELFILPADPGGLPTYVPTWQFKRVGGTASLIIEGTANGTMVFAFGNILPSAQAGVIAAAGGPPTYDFNTASDLDSVPFSLQATGFSTSNPLVMVTPIPAGGTYPNVLDGEYPNKSLFLSAGLGDKQDSLRAERFHRYYQKLVSADSSVAAPAGTHKPFAPVPVDRAAFRAATSLANPSLSLSGAGAQSGIALNIPISSSFRDGRYYADERGRASRSLEVVFTVFDGGKVSRSSGFIRTRFPDDMLQGTEKRQFDARVWNLHAYPWDEDESVNMSRIVAKTTWDKESQRFLKYKGSGTDAGSYIAYDGTNAASFPHDSGQAIWTGATQPYHPLSAGGISLDYQPFAFTPKPNTWNDMGLPFNFSMKWKDILNASGLTSLEAHRFVPKATSPDRDPEWVQLGDNSVVHPWEGITVRPTTAAPIRFPVLDSSRSATPLAKVSAGEVWSAQLRAANSTAAMTLHFGKSAEEITWGPAPDVPGQNFRVAMTRQRPSGTESLSRFMQADGNPWGHWAIKAGGEEAVRFRVVENSKAIPLHLVELLARRAVPLAAGAEVELSPEELSSGDYHVVAGDERYLEDVLNSLLPTHMLKLSNYPNPFSGNTLIRYALPESFGRVEFRLKIRDSRGRLVWERHFRGSNSLSHLWDGRSLGGKPVGAGVYSLSLEALAPGKKTRRAVLSILKM